MAERGRRLVRGARGLGSDDVDIRRRFEGTVVLDGGLATELERAGMDLRDDLWSARALLEKPEEILRVHRSYFEAGADVAISASYQASFEGFEAHGISRSEGLRLLQLSVSLARDAARDFPGALVAASVGPYGAVLADGSEYRGRYALTVRQLVAFHRPRLEALLGAQPDLLAFETIPSIEEAEAIVAILAEIPDARAWVSFSCRDGTRISDGTAFSEATALAASSPQVVAVGVNCTPPAFLPSLLASAGTDVPLLAYPNLGSEWDASSKSWRLGIGPRPDFGQEAVGWRASSVTIAGGCCGTTPDDVRAIAAALKT
jgi:homocysteine S-methyltransferase